VQHHKVLGLTEDSPRSIRPMPKRNPFTTQSQVSDADDLRTLVYAKDWSGTPIGAAEHWSPTLKILVDFLLANRFPLLLWWGPDYVSIYNDAYRPILGTKHPRALGQPFREVWPEIAFRAVKSWEISTDRHLALIG
jgi:hypothetical protein